MMQNPKDTSYVFSGYAPLSIRLVEMLEKQNGFAKMEEVRWPLSPSLSLSLSLSLIHTSYMYIIILLYVHVHVLVYLNTHCIQYVVSLIML